MHKRGGEGKSEEDGNEKDEDEDKNGGVGKLNWSCTVKALLDTTIYVFQSHRATGHFDSPPLLDTELFLHDSPFLAELPRERYEKFIHNKRQLGLKKRVTIKLSPWSVGAAAMTPLAQ
ncbi:hypothetical protein RRG08_037337 [Elysia crispata]|uniref:Uncharacterized protein n=1 Tax=Elysia crispata TaxID=231223 RepID=A0AAE1AGH3_9GAST|nr:hypothetical protein RRG08_037337 [Elysia crispata]